MNAKQVFPVIALTVLSGACAVAQTSLVNWDFSNATAGAADNIAASGLSAGIAASSLTGTGGSNGIGVIKQTYGSTKAVGSADFSGSAFEVGMNVLANRQSPLSSDYALNFNVTVGGGQQLELASFSFDLGYDTNYATTAANYFAPYAQLFVSTDGSTWAAAGGAMTLAISDPSIFSTGAGSGGVFYIQENLTVNLAGTPVGGNLSEGQTVYFRLALSDEGSATDRRRVMVNNIGLNGTLAPIPESSTYALVIGVAVLGGVLLARRRR